MDVTILSKFSSTILTITTVWNTGETGDINCIKDLMKTLTKVECVNFYLIKKVSHTKYIFGCFDRVLFQCGNYLTAPTRKQFT